MCTNKKISKEIKERRINQLDKLNLSFFNRKGLFGNLIRKTLWVSLTTMRVTR